MTAETVQVTPGAIRALAARYKYHTTRFQEASASGNEKVVKMALAAMSKIEEEALALGQTVDQLENVDTAQTVVTNNKLTHTGAEGSANAKAQPLVKPKGSLLGGGLKKSPAVVEAEKVAARAKAVAAAKAETGEIPGQTRVRQKKVKAAAKMRPCLDGCGTMVGGNFKMGHDAKLKSLIIKIERGDESIENVPEIAAGLISFKKGELVETRDSTGKVTGKVQERICTAAPVKFPGRPEIKFTVRED